MDQRGSVEYTKNTKAKIVTNKILVTISLFKNSSPRSISTSQLIYYYTYT